MRARDMLHAGYQGKEFPSHHDVLSRLMGLEVGQDMGLATHLHPIVTIKLSSTLLHVEQYKIKMYYWL